MKDFTPRFSSPLPATRPRGARLIEAYSPKLNRRVRFFDHLAFWQWIRLETLPLRPSASAPLGSTDGCADVDFQLREETGHVTAITHSVLA
jgi:hypothetical protein